NLSKIIFISIIVYSCTLVIHGIIVYFLDSEFSILISDQLVFYNRGVGVLRGDVQYRDFYTHAAPLSPYLWAPIVLISMLFTGNFSTDYLGYETYLDSTSMMFSSYVFRVFFVFCLILSAVLLYKILEMKGNKKSFWISLCFAVNPYFLYLVSFWGSDECVIPLLIMLPIYLLEKEKYYLATLTLIIGTGMKYFPLLLLPLFLNFMKQFNYPLDNARNQGIAALDEHLINYENTSGNTYEFLTLAIVITGLAGILLYFTRDKWSFEKTIALLIPFLLFFPKVQFSYFVLLFPFIFVMIFRNDNFTIVYVLIFLCTLVGGAAADFILTYQGTNILTYIASWIITAVLYFSMISALIHVFMVKLLKHVSIEI
ncbi:MAG: hypothetical protein ACTSQF_15365, partial [Candidatus Heimdallarchaeaceae archaeon]